MALADLHHHGSELLYYSMLISYLDLLLAVFVLVNRFADMYYGLTNLRDDLSNLEQNGFRVRCLVALKWPFPVFQ